MDEPPQWYIMNCVAGLEMELLQQAKFVTKDMPQTLIEKLSVPTERSLRSHGKSSNIVELKSRYPGYVFVKMRLCPETYEALEQLPLCRSWMAGTVNRQGYKKIPPAPIALSEEEVEKFQGLDDATDAIYDEFGSEYTGRGDKGIDLIDQYKGYRVEEMVKITAGNFKGEDGIIRRLKDGQVCVRLYTYGTVNDQWLGIHEIRPMTDEEAMKGLTGPKSAIGQDDFMAQQGLMQQETSKPFVRNTKNQSTLRSNLMQSLAGSSSGGRMRRQDRVSRGDRSRNSDRLGRSEQDIQEEDENWRLYNEEQRAQQQQKKGDKWGIKERSAMSGSGDDPLKSVDAQWGRSNTSSRVSGKRDGYAKNVQDAVSGAGDWDAFTSPDNNIAHSQRTKRMNNNDDDFFNTLMAELSQPDSSSNRKSKDTKTSPTTTTLANQDDSFQSKSQEDDFFSSLLSDLSASTESLSTPRTEKVPIVSTKSTEDDFFASLEADLSEK